MALDGLGFASDRLCVGQLLFQLRDALLLRKLTFQLGDARLGVFLIHQQMVPPRNRRRGLSVVSVR